MNERIKKLHDQAFAETTDYYATIQKFAELIVRECSKVADNAEPYKANDLILKHFGVE